MYVCVIYIYIYMSIYIHMQIYVSAFQEIPTAQEFLKPPRLNCEFNNHGQHALHHIAKADNIKPVR